MKKRKVIIILIIAVVCIGVAVTIIINSDPYRAFAKTFGFKLPESTEFIAYKLSKITDNCFTAKILINNNNVDTVKQGLNSYFGGELDPTMPEAYWVNDNSWWDLDENNIISRYYTIVGRKVNFGLGETTGYVWAFLAKSDDGQYYLYIDS